MTFSSEAAAMMADVASGLGSAGMVLFRAWNSGGVNPATGKGGSWATGVAVTAVRGPVEIRRETPQGTAQGAGRGEETATFAWAASESSAAAAARIGDAVEDAGVMRVIVRVRTPGDGAIIEVDTRRALKEA